MHIQEPQHFVITDPRTFDGTPYEVAERAVRQAEAMAKLTSYAVRTARLMARNAQAERELHASGTCDMAAYDSSAEGRRFDVAINDAEKVEKSMRVLALAAGFDPKAPLNG